MLSSESVAEKIFKIIKGNGFNVELFTDEGKNTVDPEEARRLYIPNTFTMVNLDETDSKREIKVSLSAGTQMEEVKDLIKQLKTLANQSIIEYTLKTFTKEITPKDFDYQAQKVRDMNVQESMSAAYGSTRSSYQKLENAKLIIKHKKPVNEEQRGSRSRNISAIYIENADGERYKFPSNNLAGGRAMLRHVKEGGNPYDELGQHIIEMCDELKQLKEFKRYSLRNNLVSEDTFDIIEAVSSRINSVREQLSKSKGGKGYARMAEEFKAKEQTINEDDIATIKDKFTVRTFDEGLDSALPYVNALIKEMEAVRERDDFAKETLNNLTGLVNRISKVNLKAGVDIKSDPENPMNNATLAKAPYQQQLGAVFEYLSGIIAGGKDDDELSVTLARMGDLVDNITDRAMLVKAANAIKALMPKLQQGGNESVERNPITTTVESKINKVFNGYNFNNLFN
jgi:hypothetical protein